MVFKKWDLNLYFDVQNVLGTSISRQTLVLDRPLDEDGKPIGAGVITNPNAQVSEQRYALKSIEDGVGDSVADNRHCSQFITLF